MKEIFLSLGVTPLSVEMYDFVRSLLRTAEAQLLVPGAGVCLSTK